MKKIIVILFANMGFAFQAVDINRASKEQIALLPGVGETLAENIVSYRKKHGAYKKKDELLVVSGMSPKKYAAILEMVNINVPQKKPSETLITKKSSELPLLHQLPVIGLSELQDLVMKNLHLKRDVDLDMMKRVRKSAWLPKLSLLFDFDKGNISTEKKIINKDDTLFLRDGRDYGIGIRATFEMADLVFNDTELEVAKLALKREGEREEILSKVQKQYFRYKRILLSRNLEKDPNILASLAIELEEITAFLDALSNNAFSLYQQSVNNNGQQL